MHKTTTRFWDCYNALPKKIRKLADQNYELLEADSRHPSLQLKKVGAFWSVRVGRDFRALAVDEEEGFMWVWIGSHEEYEKMLKK